MNINKITEKVTLPIAVVVSAIVLAVGFYAVQVNKQQSIERQQALKLEQENKEYVAKRKLECYDIEQKENEKSIYVVTDSSYNKKKDVCEIEYKTRDRETGDIEYFTKEF